MYHFGKAAQQNILVVLPDWNTSYPFFLQEELLKALCPVVPDSQQEQFSKSKKKKTIAINNMKKIKVMMMMMMYAGAGKNSDLVQ